MEELLENWQSKMELYRKASITATTQINQVKATQKFYTYRDCIKELEQALILPVVVKPLNASFKVGDKVLKSGIFDAQIIEELKPNVWKIKYPDGYEMLARTEDLYLATESV